MEGTANEDNAIAGKLPPQKDKRGNAQPPTSYSLPFWLQLAYKTDFPAPISCGNPRGLPSAPTPSVDTVSGHSGSKQVTGMTCHVRQRQSFGHRE